MTQLGRLFSAFFWVYALIQIPVGWLAERYGAHRVLAAGLVIWASATTLTGATGSFAMLIALRMMLGLGESAGFPCVSKLLASVVPIGGLGKANGIVGFGYLIGPGVGIIRRRTPDDQFGWRGTFPVFGLLSLLWLVPWAREAAHGGDRSAAMPRRPPGDDPQAARLVGHDARALLEQLPVVFHAELAAGLPRERARLFHA